MVLVADLLRARGFCHVDKLARLCPARIGGLWFATCRPGRWRRDSVRPAVWLYGF